MVIRGNHAGSCAAPAEDDEPELVSLIRNKFLDSTASRIFPAGIELFQQDYIARELLLVESGLVKLMRTESNGRQFIVSLRFAGSLLGASAVVSGQRHPFCAVTTTRCTLLQIPAVTFIQSLVQDQQLCSVVHRMLGHEVSELSINMTHLACIPVLQRLQQLLWRLIKNEQADYKVGNKIRLPLKYWEVAELLAITPAYLTRLFIELENKGLLLRQKGWIVVTTPDNLWHEPTLAPITI